jgi:hypothetical protein
VLRARSIAFRVERGRFPTVDAIVRIDPDVQYADKRSASAGRAKFAQNRDDDVAARRFDVRACRAQRRRGARPRFAVDELSEYAR